VRVDHRLERTLRDLTQLLFRDEAALLLGDGLPDLPHQLVDVDVSRRDPEAHRPRGMGDPAAV
jgi:hypothetical protein